MTNDELILKKQRIAEIKKLLEERKKNQTTIKHYSWL